MLIRGNNIVAMNIPETMVVQFILHTLPDGSYQVERAEGHIVATYKKVNGGVQ